MPSYLRIVWLLMGLASMAALVVLFLLPVTWTVEEEIVIDATPEAIWPHLIDLRSWPAWSPWQEGAYEDLVYEYSETTRGVGAEQRWDTEETGDGVLRLTAAQEPRWLELVLEMQEGAIVARETLTLEPLPGGSTRVTWLDRGELGHTLLGRLSLPVIEESMGRDLSRGLASLKEVVEAGGGPPAQPAGEGSVSPATPSPQRDAT